MISPRSLEFRHEKERLVGSLILKPDAEGPLTVRLQPWGTVTGRLVDVDGQPRADIESANLWQAASQSGTAGGYRLRHAAGAVVAPTRRAVSAWRESAPACGIPCTRWRARLASVERCLKT